MIQLFINSLLACIMLPDAEAFIQCVDDVVLEYNLSIEWNDMM